MKHTRWVASIIGYVKWGFILGLSLIAAKTAFNLSMTGVQKYIIDEVFLEQRYDLLWPVLFVFLASVLLYNGCHIIGEMILNINSRKANIWLLDKYMQSVHKLHSGILKKERIGRLTQYYTQEINSVTSILGPGGLFSDGLQKLLSLIILAVIVGLNSPLILLVLLAIGIVYIPLGKHYKTILRGAAKQTQERMADIGVQISEGISSTREVVAFNRMNWEKGILQGLFDRYFHVSMKELGLANKQAFLSESMRLGTAFFVLAYGGFEVVRGSLSLGMFIIIFQFSNQLMTSIGGLYQSVMQIPSTLASIDRLRGVMEGDQRIDGTVTLDEPIRTIEFRDVGFRYEADSNPVLQNFSMRWNADGKMAVVGTSGGGKSTIAQLLVRFYDPDAGTILVNGLSLDRITFASWSDKTTIVFQDPYLFPDTIHNNLKMDLEACTEEELIAACKMACIHEEIMKLPDGYHTSLGERGVTLSGGQRQRLAIARALLRNPEVLILDEATSALDLETERKVMNHLDTVRKGRLTVVIAHRLSTVINAEQIYVVDRGQVSEYGTHQDLLHRGAKYAELLHLAYTG